MGLSFSSRQDIYLNQFCNPLTKECSEDFLIKCYLSPTDNVTLVFPKENPFAHIVSDKIPGQFVVILGIYLNYIQSDFEDDDVKLILSGLFKKNSHNEDVEAPDDSGEITILCPKKFDSAVRGNDRILYKPRIPDHILRDYAGVSNAIANAKEGDAFPKDHPMVHFVKTYMKDIPLPLFQHGEELCYTMDKDVFQKVQTAFKNQIYEDIHETRFEYTRIHGKLDKPASKEREFPLSICITLKMNYLLVTPGEMKMKIKEIKI